MEKAIFIIPLLLLIGCTSVSYNKENQTQQCFVQTCHFESYELFCTKEPFGPCTLEYLPSDFCGQFVSCNEQCELEEQEKYRECLDCFLLCNNRSSECTTTECLEKFPEFINTPIV